MVRDIIMRSNCDSDNASCQSPDSEHAHINLIKAVAECTNDKDALVCIGAFMICWPFMTVTPRKLWWFAWKEVAKAVVVVAVAVGRASVLLQ